MPAPIYRTNYPTDCLAHHIDGMMLVFHKPSGATHFLADPIGEMLTIIADAPCDAAALARRLCDRLGAELDDEAEAVIHRHLDDLTGSGLIRTA